MTTLLVPPGTKVMAHIHPDKRGSWELNGEVGWYVGPALNHYYCLEVYFLRTCETRYCDMVEFIPHSIPFPIVKLKDFLIQAVTNIIIILMQPQSRLILSLQKRDLTRNTLLELA